MESVKVMQGERKSRYVSTVPADVFVPEAPSVAGQLFVSIRNYINAGLLLALQFCTRTRGSPGRSWRA